jgi:hypothetical protein
MSAQRCPRCGAPVGLLARLQTWLASATTPPPPPEPTRAEVVTAYLAFMERGDGSWLYPPGSYGIDAAHREAYATIDAETADLNGVTYPERVREWRRRRLAAKAAHAGGCLIPNA